MVQFLTKMLMWTGPGVLLCAGLWFGLVQAEPGRDLVGLNRVLPKTCNSMIFGSSRSGQGVNPTVLEMALPASGKWQNFSFNLAVSPWNDAYVDAIEQKLECSLEADEAPHFLVFVDPWMLDGLTGGGEKTWLNADWADVCNMNTIRFAWHKTNPLDVIGYGSGMDLFGVIATVPGQLMQLTSGTESISRKGLMSNGWLPNPKKKSPREIAKAIDEKVDVYRKGKTIGEIWPGPENIAALNRCIQILKTSASQSKIYLVRPPTSEKMRALEDEWFPDTNRELRRISKQHAIAFLDTHHDWSERDMRHFNDGHHLNMEGANAFSQYLAQAIESQAN